MQLEQILAEIAVEVTPDGVNVIGVVGSPMTGGPATVR